MRYFMLALTGLLCMVFMLDLGCAVEERVDDDFISIDGLVVYGSGVVSGARVALLDAETFDLIDEATSDDDGYFVLNAGSDGNFTLLAGLEDEQPLMAEINLVVNGDLSMDIKLESAPVYQEEEATDDRMLISENPVCWNVSKWWHFCYRCCYYPSSSWYVWCGWYWC